MNIPSWQDGVNLPWRDTYAVPAKEYITVIPVPIWKTPLALAVVLRVSMN